MFNLKWSNIFEREDAEDDEEFDPESTGKLFVDDDKCNNLDLFILWKSFGTFELVGVNIGETLLDSDFVIRRLLSQSSIDNEDGLS